MTITQQIVTIAVVVLGTMTTRFLPFLIFPESGHYGVPELITIVFIAILHKWKRSTLFSIGGGTVLYMLLVQMVF